MKRILVLISTFAIMLTLCTTAFAADTSSSSSSRKIQGVNDDYSQMQEKFSALSDSEKKQIYGITDEIEKQTEALIEKYASLGIMSAEKAAGLIAMISGSHEQAKENERIIFGMIPPPVHKK